MEAMTQAETGKAKSAMRQLLIVHGFSFAFDRGFF